MDVSCLFFIAFSFSIFCHSISASENIFTVYFENNSYRLTPEAISILDISVEGILEKNSFNIDLSGYTDSIGSKAHNLKLSKNRSAAVKNYLISKGIPSSRIFAKWSGELNPPSASKDDVAVSENRCVVIRIH